MARRFAQGGKFGTWRVLHLDDLGFYNGVCEAAASYLAGIGDD